MTGHISEDALISAVLRWLAGQPDVYPELWASQVPSAEHAAGQLLLCLHVQPDHRAGDVAGEYSRDDPIDTSPDAPWVQGWHVGHGLKEHH